MFRHRKRLIAKRLSKLMKKKNQKYIKELFTKFIERRNQQVQNLIPFQEEDAIELKEQISSQHEQQIEEEQGESQMSLSDYISTLSSEEKRMFKKQNPELPETFFMSKKQKQKFFSRKNSKFTNDLKHTPERHSKTKNHVHFKDQFVYKPFSSESKVGEVRKAKQLNSSYDNKIHFS